MIIAMYVCNNHNHNDNKKDDNKDHICQVHRALPLICRSSDYIIGFIAPAIGPNKSKKLTRLIIVPVHNIRGKV